MMEFVNVKKFKRVWDIVPKDLVTVMNEDILAGMSNIEVARKYGIGSNTVSRHCGKAIRKRNRIAKQALGEVTKVWKDLKRQGYTNEVIHNTYGNGYSLAAVTKQVKNVKQVDKPKVKKLKVKKTREYSEAEIMKIEWAVGLREEKYMTFTEIGIVMSITAKTARQYYRIGEVLKSRRIAAIKRLETMT